MSEGTATHPDGTDGSRRPNILLVVSDEERRTDWLAGHADLPAHDRLTAEGLTFRRHFTHTSPCSPSRASLYTGRYLHQHGVVDNVSFPTHTALDPALPTLGQLLRGVGYRTAYLGKWHLSHSNTPDMEAHGYADWTGDDVHYTGSAWSGRHFDPLICDQAVSWLADHADDTTPWFLTVALVNPHDIMWFPIDQPDHLATHPADREIFDAIRRLRLGDLELEPPPPIERRFDRLPDNFDDDLHTKPEVQRAWRHVRNTEHFVGRIDPDDTEMWLRQLDYYAWLHEHLDVSLGRLLDAVDRQGLSDDTVVVYTSDHGDACGSHGLRAKLPCVYEEVMGVPLVVRAPGRVTPGSVTDALSTHVDLAATICALAGVDPSGAGLPGVDLGPVLDDPSTSVREAVFFAQDSAQSELIRNCRYAVRGFFDGTTKYARYYGIGGGIRRDGTPDPEPKLFGPDAAFDECDHEWYQLDDDPGELRNRAVERAFRHETRDLFARLLALEYAELGEVAGHDGTP